MYQELFETSRLWRASVGYQGSRGPQTVYLMDDGRISGGYYWLIANNPAQWPQIVRPYDLKVTARMIEAGKMRLLKGEWPEGVLELLGMLPEPPSSCPRKYQPRM
jgi:hypothetical protein